MHYRVVGSHMLTEFEFRETRPSAGLESAPILATDGFMPTPIRPGGPLSVQIRHVYTGQHPKRGFLQSSRQDMIVTSALKDYAVYAPATRAVNFLGKKISSHSLLKTPKATEEGTPVIAYYPAVIADSLTLTLEIAFDAFDDGLTTELGSAFKSLGELPMFLSIGGYLLLGGSLVKLAGDIADRLVDGTPKFSETLSLNFRPENGPVTAANLQVVCGRSFDVSSYRYDWAQGLVHKVGSAPYDGDEPYIVLLIDGAERPGLKNFAATAASAAMLDQFFSAKSGAEVGIGGFVDAMRLLNDFNFRADAEKLAKQIDKAGLSDQEKAGLIAKYNALVSNIQTDQFELPKL